MAKKLPGRTEGAGDPRKSPDRTPRPILISMRGRREWKAWFDGLAASERVSGVVLIDRALTLYAKHVGYASPPER